MAKLSPDKTPTVEVKAVAFTDREINAGLKEWSGNLKAAKDSDNVFEQDTARRWLNVWLDRKLEAMR